MLLIFPVQFFPDIHLFSLSVYLSFFLWLFSTIDFELCHLSSWSCMIGSSTRIRSTMSVAHIVYHEHGRSGSNHCCGKGRIRRKCISFKIPRYGQWFISLTHKAYQLSYSSFLYGIGSKSEGHDSRRLCKNVNILVQILKRTKLYYLSIWTFCDPTSTILTLFFFFEKKLPLTIKLVE